MKMHSVVAAAGLAVAVASPAALAVGNSWAFNAATDSVAVPHSDAAGVLNTIQTTFNPVSKRLDWTVTFSNRTAQGFTLAMDGGPNPKGHAGELALLYFDATTLAAPKLTAYGYNGQNNLTSWQDGNGEVAGNQAPDTIRSATNTSWIYNISATDIGATGRQLSFSIDATSLINRTPIYTNPQGGWSGIGFGNQLGVWFHPVSGLTTSYNTAGFLTSWGRTAEGYLDAQFLTTVVVPLPTTAGLAAAGLLIAAATRRRM